MTPLPQVGQAEPHPLDLSRIPRDLPSSEYKLGDEFKPFHPSASHVPPEYRDGWNRCWLAALAQPVAQQSAAPLEDLRGAMVQAVEATAQEWDGCEYDAPGGMIDIGDAIRRAMFPRINAAASQVSAAIAPLAERQPIESRLTRAEAMQLLCIRDYIDRQEDDNAMAALAHLFDHEGTMVYPFAALEQRAAPPAGEAVPQGGQMP